MAIPSKQIGWGTSDNLLWQISKQLETLTKVTYNSAMMPPFSGDFLPALDDTYNLGSTTLKWKSLHLGEGTLYITDTVTGNEAALTVTDGVLYINGISALAISSVVFPDDSEQTTAYIPAAAQSFNPSFTDASGTLAGVTATGSYTMLSPKVCFFRVRADFSGCTNFGTLGYQITLPFASIETMRQANGTLHQVTGGALYHIAGITDSDTAPSNIMKFYYSGSTTDLVWKYNTPVGGTTVTSHFDISGVYEIV
jgi:hypothetical protein